MKLAQWSSLTVTWMIAVVPIGEVCACDCEGIAPLDAREQSDVVFEGRVTATFLPLFPAGPFGELPHRIVDFQVSTIWKGSLGSRVRVFMPRDSGTCGPDSVNLGERFLVYANCDAAAQQLQTNECLRTKKWDSLHGGAMDIPVFEEAGFVPVELVASEEALCGGSTPKLCGIGVIGMMGFVFTALVTMRNGTKFSIR